MGQSPDDFTLRAKLIPPLTRSRASQRDDVHTISSKHTSAYVPSPASTLPQVPCPDSSDDTLQAPIKTAVATRYRYWVFEYRTRVGDHGHTAFYTMRCPASCAQPVFSKHPLLQDRAAKHLESCGQPFDNEMDMVRRYSRRGKQLT